MISSLLSTTIRLARRGFGSCSLKTSQLVKDLRRHLAGGVIRFHSSLREPKGGVRHDSQLWGDW